MKKLIGVVELAGFGSKEGYYEDAKNFVDTYDLPEHFLDELIENQFLYNMYEVIANVAIFEDASFETQFIEYNGRKWYPAP